MLKIGGNEAYEINDEDASLVSRGVRACVRLSGLSYGCVSKLVA